MLPVVTCPSCWHRFDPGTVCFIAEHASLAGDPVLGHDDALRFHPTRLDELGRALDPEGALCTRLACPRCHLELPRAALELRPIAISTVGAPASGKSHLLVASTWRLRQLAATGGPGFDDADPTLNAWLHEQETSLFLEGSGRSVAMLPKTETAGAHLYRDVFVAGQIEALPMPLLFTVGPMQTGTGPSRERRLLVLQDNAGEHLLPGRDRSARDATGHLARSDAILIVLDPLQDRRFRGAAGLVESTTDGGAALRIAERQELVVAEVATRIRRLAGLDAAAPIERPVVVAMTKADLWAHLIAEVDLATPPIRALDDEDIDLAALDAAHAGCSALLERFCPEIAAVIRGAFAEPRFIPVSALGCTPVWIEGASGPRLGVPAGQLRPRWSEIPLLVLMTMVAQRHGTHRSRDGAASRSAVARRSGQTASVKPGARR